MRMRGAILLAFVLLPIATLPALADDEMRSGCGRQLGVGGGILAGGYFGEVGQDWDLGLGGSLFLQGPIGSAFEGRLRASMLWNDGSREIPVRADAPDLGALPGDRARSFRRASYELSLLWTGENHFRSEFAVPYLGGGISTYERRVEFLRAGGGPADNGLASIQVHSAWDWGYHGIIGMRFYRTTGMFVGLEGTVHAIDTPNEWTAAYDLSLLLGVELNR